MDTNRPEEAKIPCSECQAGHMRHQYVTYFTWLGEDLITVPDFPAWICDVCGKREYDPQALSQLKLLLNPNSNKPSSPARPRLPKDRNKKIRPGRPE